ncbi:MAG: hypothetical protein OXN89_16855 [Bryobacterales bacterium]|nr:hypothetical protein [Bryobacterales bacterium]
MSLCGDVIAALQALRVRVSRSGAKVWFGGLLFPRFPDLLSYLAPRSRYAPLAAGLLNIQGDRCGESSGGWDRGCIAQHESRRQRPGIRLLISGLPVGAHGWGEPGEAEEAAQMARGP